MMIKDINYTLKQSVRSSDKGQLVKIGPEITITFGKGHSGYMNGLKIGSEIKRILKSIQNEEEEKVFSLISKNNLNPEDLKKIFSEEEKKEEKKNNKSIEEIRFENQVKSIFKNEDGVKLINKISENLKDYLLTSSGTQFSDFSMDELSTEDRHGIITSIISFFISS